MLHRLCDPVFAGYTVSVVGLRVLASVKFPAFSTLAKPSGYDVYLFFSSVPSSRMLSSKAREIANALVDMFVAVPPHLCRYRGLAL